MMTKHIAALLVAASLWAPALPAQAAAVAAVAPANASADSALLVPVAEGCGWGRWRGPWGGCRGPGYGYAPRPWGWNGCPPGYWRGPWGHCRDTPYHGRLPGGGWQ